MYGGIVLTMHVQDNPADERLDNDGWRIASQHLDQETGEWELAWQRDGDREPTRWLRSRNAFTSSGLRVEGHGPHVFINLPARVRSRQVVDERANGRVWRSSEYEVVADLVCEGSDGPKPHAVVDSVTVRRLGRVSVTASVLRFPLGELFDWALTRNPVAERSGHSFLGAGHPAAAEARRITSRKTGKRGPDVVSLEAVAEVARSAPARGQGEALREAFPNVGRSTLLEALRIARLRDPSLHTERSRRAAERRG